MSNELQNDQEYDIEDLDKLEIKISNELLEGFKDLSFLEEERAKIKDVDAFTKVIGDEILTKFQSQFNLEKTDETLVQSNARKRYEEIESEGNKRVQDHEKIIDVKTGKVTYNKKEYSKEKGGEIQRGKGFVFVKNELDKKQNSGELFDEYTGKKLQKGDKFDVDHVESKKNIYNNFRRQQAGVETEDLANMDENLMPTNPNLNRSKQDKTVDEYLELREQRQIDLEKNRSKNIEKIKASDKTDLEKKLEIEKVNQATDNKLAADEKNMKDAARKSEKARNKKIKKELTTKIGKDSFKKGMQVIINSAAVEFIREIMGALSQFLKSTKKSFGSLLDSIERGISNFINKIKGIVESGAKNAIGNIVAEIFAPIVDIFKKLGKVIKQGVSSFVDVIKYLKSPQSKSHTMAEKMVTISKIVLAGTTIIGAVTLGELFEKILYSVPGMGFKVPFLGTLANIIGMFLSSVVVGVIGAIILNLINKWVSDSLKVEKDGDILKKQSEILAKQNYQQQIGILNTEKILSKAEQSIVNMHKDYELETYSDTYTELEKQRDRNYDIFD